LQQKEKRTLFNCRSIVDISHSRRNVPAERLYISVTRGRFYNFFRGKFTGENSAEIVPLQMSGKIGIFHGKSFEKSFPREIPRKDPQKITVRGKQMYENLAPG
jgi:hypothetical protein